MKNICFIFVNYLLNSNKVFEKVLAKLSIKSKKKNPSKYLDFTYYIIQNINIIYTLFGEQSTKKNKCERK